MHKFLGLLLLVDSVIAAAYNGVPYRCLNATNVEIPSDLCVFDNVEAVSFLIGNFSVTNIVKIWYPGDEGVKEEFFRCATDFIAEEAALGNKIAFNITCTGWGNIVSYPITENDYPDMIMLGTTQLGAREALGDIQVLNSWIGKL
ncbi:hypothetical protein HK100_009108, partial [Physocladia obscura]